MTLKEISNNSLYTEIFDKGWRYGLFIGMTIAIIASLLTLNVAQ